MAMSETEFAEYISNLAKLQRAHMTIISIKAALERVSHVNAQGYNAGDFKALQITRDTALNMIMSYEELNK